MHRQRGERGVALIMLIGITATLAILASTLVMVLANQQRATAQERTRKTSQQYADGALDTAVTFAKAKKISQTDGSWLTTQELLDAFAEGFDGGVLPEGMTVQFFVYDNSSGAAAYDANHDGMMWVEVVLAYQGKTTRARVLIRQREESVISAFPKAVVYSDTGIRLDGTSDVYAVEADNITPWAPAPPWATTIMVGGGMSTASGARDFTANSVANLAAPTSTVQSVNIQANGSVSPTGKFNGTISGGIGLLSDYFDQAAQADLCDEAQVGETHAAAPTAPTAPPAPTPTPSTTLSSTDITNIQNSSTTTAYTTYQNTSAKTAASTNITISRTTARTLYFKDLYVRGNLSITGPVTLVVTGFLRVDGTLALNNTTATAVTDTFSGPVYVGSTSASSVAGKVTFSGAPSFYTAGALTLSNTFTSVGQLYANGNLALSGNAPVTATSSVYSGGTLTVSGATSAITDQFGSLYVAGTGTSAVSGTVTLNATSSIYAAGPLALSNTLTTTGLFYAAAAYSSTTPALSITGNATVKSTALVVALGNFRISGATSPVTNYFGPVWVGGPSASATWSGTASVRTTNYTNALLPAGPMWITILNRSGTFNDVYGYVWLTGNAGTANVAWQVTGPSSGTACTIMCPLLATTEKTVTAGKVDYGTPTAPMVYYMVCDNDTLYSNTCEWGGSGTFYGLMVIMEACLEITGGNGVTPCVLGAVFNGTPYKSGTSPSVNDITLSGASTVAYSQSILDAIISTSIKTTTTVTQIVPGSWQQLPAN